MGHSVESIFSWFVRRGRLWTELVKSHTLQNIQVYCLCKKMSGVRLNYIKIEISQAVLRGEIEIPRGMKIVL